MSNEEIAIDVSKMGISKDKIKDFFKKYGIILLVLIPVILAVGIRMIPSDLPMTDQWATSSVEQYYLSQIKAQIRQQYPALPDSNVESTAAQQYADYYKQNKQTIAEQIKQTSQGYKSIFQDENGFTYMPDIDPYTYLRLTENYINHGYAGDEIRNGTQWDTHSLAPKGRPASKTPHVVVLAYLYKIMKIFNEKITVMQSSTYFSVIFSALSIIPIFFIGRMLAGTTGGFFAAIMMAVNGAFLGRTTWGHADTDAYNILFAVYLVWFFFLALQSKDIKKTAMFASIAGLISGIFSKFWIGWWYVFDFMLGTAAVYAAYLIIRKKSFSITNIKQDERLKHLGIVFSVFIVASAIFITLFTSFATFTNSVIEPITFSNIKSASHADLWPNVYTTVAELNSASIDSVISSVGGKMYFYISILGILLLLLYKKDGIRTHLPYAVLFIMWYVGIIYASTKGIRFTMMLVPPLSLAFGSAIGIIKKKTENLLEKMDIPKKITGIVFIILICLLLLPYVKANANAVRNEVPIINDAWYNSLTKIKTESAPNAIVNSWWDFGHHFKYFTDRAVTFDGATQNSPMAHWIGKVLLTNDEKQAIGILRMLDCGSNDAFEILDSHVNDTSASVKIIYEIIAMDKSGAETHLINKNVPKEIVKKITEKTHCNPPENYFITSEDMVSKGAVWGHFGSWNFDRADIWVEARNLPKEEAIARIQKQLTLNEEDAKKTYYEIKSLTSENEGNAWIASWPGYAQETGCTKQDNKLICGGIVVDLATMDAKVSTDKGEQIFNSISYVENDEFKIKQLGGNLGYALLLFSRNGQQRVMLASPQLADSIFTRLFFFEGVGLNSFQKFGDETQPTGDRIIVWKVKW